MRHSLTLVIGAAKSGKTTAIYRRAVAAKNSPTRLVHIVDPEHDALRMQDLIRAAGGDPDDAGWLLYHRSAGDLAESWLWTKVREGDALVIDQIGQYRLHGDPVTFEGLQQLARTLRVDLIVAYQEPRDLAINVEVLPRIE